MKERKILCKWYYTFPPILLFRKYGNIWDVLGYLWKPSDTLEWSSISLVLPGWKSHIFSKSWQVNNTVTTKSDQHIYAWTFKIFPGILNLIRPEAYNLLKKIHWQLETTSHLKVALIITAIYYLMLQSCYQKLPNHWWTWSSELPLSFETSRGIWTLPTDFF